MLKIRIGDTNMLVSKMLKFALPQTPNPNVSRWNIGGFGSPTQGAGIGHVHFMFFCVDFIALGTQRKHVFSGIWA